jgi:hypothetical protein
MNISKRVKAMTTPNRRETLEQLHREIEAALANNDTTQARLDGLKADIQLVDHHSKEVG